MNYHLTLLYLLQSTIVNIYSMDFTDSKNIFIIDLKIIKGTEKFNFMNFPVPFNYKNLVINLVI